MKFVIIILSVFTLTIAIRIPNTWQLDKVEDFKNFFTEENRPVRQGGTFSPAGPSSSANNHKNNILNAGTNNLNNNNWLPVVTLNNEYTFLAPPKINTVNNPDFLNNFFSPQLKDENVEKKKPYIQQVHIPPRFTDITGKNLIKKTTDVKPTSQDLPEQNQVQYITYTGQESSPQLSTLGTIPFVQSINQGVGIKQLYPQTNNQNTVHQFSEIDFHLRNPFPQNQNKKIPIQDESLTKINSHNSGFSAGPSTTNHDFTFSSPVIQTRPAIKSVNNHQVSKVPLLLHLPNNKKNKQSFKTSNNIQSAQPLANFDFDLNNPFNTNYRDDKTHEPIPYDPYYDRENIPKVQRLQHEKAPVGINEYPAQVPVRPIYPGEGQWAKPGVKHRPFISHHKFVPLESSKTVPDGYDTFIEGQKLFDQQNREFGKKLQEFPVRHQLSTIPNQINNLNIVQNNRQNHYYQQQKVKENPQEDIGSEEEEDKKDIFVPMKLYAQVRHTEDEKHLPPAADENGRLKELIKDSKVQTVYSEEGYEDSAYDHAGHEKNAENAEHFEKDEKEVVKKDQKKEPSKKLPQRQTTSYSIEDSNLKEEDFQKLKNDALNLDTEDSETAGSQLEEKSYISKTKPPKKVYSARTKGFKKPNVATKSAIVPADDEGTKTLATIVKDNGDTEMEISSEVKVIVQPNNSTKSHKYIKIYPKAYKITNSKNNLKQNESTADDFTTESPFTTLTPTEFTEIFTMEIPSTTQATTAIPKIKGSTPGVLENVKHTPQKASKKKRQKRFVNYFPNIAVDTHFIDDIKHELGKPEKKVDLTEVKYPYYANYENMGLHENSPLRYSEDLRLVPVKNGGELAFYGQADKRRECSEVNPHVEPVPEKIKEADENPEAVEDATDVEELVKSPRLGQLGDKIDCFKAKYFGENPLDNPIFQEQLVGTVKPIFQEIESITKKQAVKSNQDREVPKLLNYRTTDRQSVDKRSSTTGTELINSASGYNEENEIKDDVDEIYEKYVKNDIYPTFFDQFGEKEDTEESRKEKGATEAGKENSATPADAGNMRNPKDDVETINITSKHSIKESLREAYTLPPPTLITTPKYTIDLKPKHIYDQIKLLHYLPVEDYFDIRTEKKNRPVEKTTTETSIEKFVPGKTRSKTDVPKIKKNRSKSREKVNNKKSPQPNKEKIISNNKYRKTGTLRLDVKNRNISQSISDKINRKISESISDKINRGTSDRDSFERDVKVLKDEYKKINRGKTNKKTNERDSLEREAKVPKRDDSIINGDNTNRKTNDRDNFGRDTEAVKQDDKKNNRNKTNRKTSDKDSLDREPKALKHEVENVNRENYDVTTPESLPEAEALKRRRRTKIKPKKPQYEIFDVNQYLPKVPYVTPPYTDVILTPPKPISFNSAIPKAPVYEVFDINKFLPTTPFPLFSQSTVLPKYKVASEVFYKDDIKPNEQLNVFTDVINNIKSFPQILQDISPDSSNNNPVSVKINKLMYQHVEDPSSNGDENVGETTSSNLLTSTTISSTTKPVRLRTRYYKNHRIHGTTEAMQEQTTENIKPYYETNRKHNRKQKPTTTTIKPYNDIHYNLHRNHRDSEKSDEENNNYETNNKGKRRQRIKTTTVKVPITEALPSSTEKESTTVVMGLVPPEVYGYKTIYNSKQDHNSYFIKDEIAAEKKMNKFLVSGMKPPPRQKVYNYSDFLTVNHIQQRTGKPRRGKRSANRPAYAEVSRNRGRQGTTEESPKLAKADDDDYVPQRQRNYHYDEETGKIVYDKKPKVQEEESEEVEYIEVIEEAPSSTTTAPKQNPIFATATPPPEGQSFIDFVKKLKSASSYHEIPDPTTTEKGKEETTEQVASSTTLKVVSTTPPEFLSILAKVRNDSNYKTIEDKKKTKGTTTTEPPETEEVIEEEEEESQVENVRNSPGAPGVVNGENFKLFDITDFLPKVKSYLPKTSIDTSRYKSIQRPSVKHSFSSRNNSDEEKNLQNINTSKELIYESDSKEAAQEIPTNPTGSTTTTSTPTRRSTTTTTTEAPATTQKAIRSHSRKRTTTMKTTSTTQIDLTTTSASTTTANIETPHHEKVRRTYRRRNPRIKTTTTENFLNDQTDDTTKILRRRSETDTSIFPIGTGNNEQILEDSLDAPVLLDRIEDYIDHTGNDSKNEHLNNTDAGEVVKRVVEIFKNYDQTKKHGGNYKKENEFETNSNKLEQDGKTKLIHSAENTNQTTIEESLNASKTDSLDALADDVAAKIGGGNYTSDEEAQLKQDENSSLEVAEVNNVEILKEHDKSKKLHDKLENEKATTHIKENKTEGESEGEKLENKDDASVEVFKNYDKTKKHGGNYRSENEDTVNVNGEQQFDESKFSPPKDNLKESTIPEIRRSNDIEVFKSYDKSKKHGGNYKSEDGAAIKEKGEYIDDSSAPKSGKNAKHSEIKESAQQINKAKDIEIFNNYDKNKKHGGNYRYENKQEIKEPKIEETKYTKPNPPDQNAQRVNYGIKNSQKLVDNILKPESFYSDPKLPGVINGLKIVDSLSNEELEEIVASVENEDDLDKSNEHEEKENQNALEFGDKVAVVSNKESQVITTVKPIFIKDPSKRLYYYAPVR